MEGNVSFRTYISRQEDFMADKFKDKDTDEILEHIDPVCGMTVNPDSAAGKSRFENDTFYFCSTDCKKKFDMQPAEYAKSVIPK